MEYAILGRTGLRVSRLGFGCMRLPMASSSEVDRQKAIPLLHRAFELGVNLFDSGVTYCGGDSQRVVGEALEDIRDKVILSTKNHHRDRNDRDTWWRYLEESLESLRTDSIDIYNAHGLNFEIFERAYVGKGGLYELMLKAQEEGLIKHICHSFHGSAESLMKVADTGLFESVICQYNLLDRHLEDAIAYAAEKGMGVLIMGPVGGGRLGYPSEKAMELMGEVKSTPELALRFVLSNPHVTAALSGMSTIEMLEENVATAGSAGSLSEEDNTAIAAAIQERKELLGLYCTGCGYCMPCPEGVDIPANFEILNLERVFGLTDHARGRYGALAGKAALCRLCGKCVPLCPQELDIPARLAEAVAALDPRAGRVTGWTELRGARRAGKGHVKVQLRYHLKSFVDETFQSVRLEFQPHAGQQVAPQKFGFRNLKPYARRRKDIEVLVPAPLETLSLQALLDCDGRRTMEHVHYVVTTARRVKGYRLSPRTRRDGAAHVPSAHHPIRGSKRDVTGHSFDFTASYDNKSLYVSVDVEDDLLHAATEPIVGWWQKADNVAVFLDGRAPDQLGREGAGRGVMNFKVYPSAEPDAEPQVKASSGQVKVKLARTGVGYRVDCAVPWEVFSQAGGRPGVIGFDVVLTSYDEKGENALGLSWTGRSGQERNAATYGRLLIV